MTLGVVSEFRGNSTWVVLLVPRFQQAQSQEHPEADFFLFRHPHFVFAHYDSIMIYKSEWFVTKTVPEGLRLEQYGEKQDEGFFEIELF